ncbi:molybdenum cofactor guanylyltransferase MobA [Undibacterium sp. CY18W]|uniref:Molybdenum cofactor guanylyltransferase n=1 Tax=Undibacterium hunanense TaxID=2762292 RepID=A0ABR6ZL90_9BURK|nr:molybdenum cofactor guanylyltransferase MobA [Undibacterium hunanense]MBC3916298.1 molybdenum cofactor guanylyltransferase MobA [Undibacterium hunanense]
MTTIDKNLITGLILAGGRGTRMGTVDKGLQDFRGQPLIRHVLSALSAQTGTVIINANQNLAVYQSLGMPVVSDLLAGFAGPLAGLQAGLLACTTPYLVCAPCDSPLLPADLVKRLARALHNDGSDVAVAFTMENLDGGSVKQVHPVFALMKTGVSAQLTAYLQDGGRRVNDWHASLLASEVLFEDSAAFRNINTRKELQELEH